MYDSFSLALSNEQASTVHASRVDAGSSRNSNPTPNPNTNTNRFASDISIYEFSNRCTINMHFLLHMHAELQNDVPSRLKAWSFEREHRSQRTFIHSVFPLSCFAIILHYYFFYSMHVFNLQLWGSIISFIILYILPIHTLYLYVSYTKPILLVEPIIPLF